MPAMSTSAIADRRPVTALGRVLPGSTPDPAASAGFKTPAAGSSTTVQASEST